MIVLDTNVVSELMRPRADARVVAAVDQHPTDDIHLTAITTAEIRYGVARLPAGRRRTDLTERIEQVIEVDFADRVLPFDDEAAACYALIATTREQGGSPISMADAQIAAICRSYQAALMTRNGEDFRHTGVELIDPWVDRPS